MGAAPSLKSPGPPGASRPDGGPVGGLPGRPRRACAGVRAPLGPRPSHPIPRPSCRISSAWRCRFGSPAAAKDGRCGRRRRVRTGFFRPATSPGAVRRRTPRSAQAHIRAAPPREALTPSRPRVSLHAPRPPVSAVVPASLTPGWSLNGRFGGEAERGTLARATARFPVPPVLVSPPGGAPSSPPGSRSPAGLPRLLEATLTPATHSHGRGDRLSCPAPDSVGVQRRSISGCVPDSGSSPQPGRARPLPATRGCWRGLPRGQGRRRRGAGRWAGPGSSRGQGAPPRGLGLSRPRGPASGFVPLLCESGQISRHRLARLESSHWRPLIPRAPGSPRTVGGTGRVYKHMDREGPLPKSGAARKDLTGLSAGRALLKLKESHLKMPFCFFKIIKK